MQSLRQAVTSAQLGKLTTIGAMYMAQTSAFGFIAQLLPAIYREQGLALDQFWIFSIALAPFALKFLWAPYVDRYGNERFGRRRSWIVPCTTLAATVYIGLSFFDPSPDALLPVVACVFVIALLLGTQEVAVDGYFVENLEKKEHGLAAGVRCYMDALAELGALAGLGLLYQRFGWEVAVCTAAGGLVLLTLPGMLRKERPISRREVAPGSEHQVASLARFLRRRDSLYIVPLLICLGGTGMYFAMVGAFLVDKGFAIDQIGLALGICVMVGFFIGGPLAVSLVQRAGLRLALRVVAVLAIPLFLSAIWLAWAPPQTLLITIVALALPTMLLAQITILYTAARLGWASGTQAGTDFSMQSAAVRVGAAMGIGAGGWVAARVGWELFFVFYGLYAFAVVLAFYFLTDMLGVLVDKRNTSEAVSQ